MNFEQMTNKVCCVINANINYDDLEKFSQLGLQYFIIKHDRDTDKNGELKTIHYHLVLVRSTRSRVKWFFIRIVDALKIKENQLSIMACDSLVASVQYLVHKNDSDKYQYCMFDIQSNVSYDAINGYLSKDLTKLELDFETLQEICINCAFRTYDIMRVIGLGRYNAFRNTINDFIREFKPIYEREMIDNELKDLKSRQ